MTLQKTARVYYLHTHVFYTFPAAWRQAEAVWRFEAGRRGRDGVLRRPQKAVLLSGRGLVLPRVHGLGQHQGVLVHRVLRQRGRPGPGRGHQTELLKGGPREIAAVAANGTVGVPPGAGRAPVERVQRVPRAASRDVEATGKEIDLVLVCRSRSRGRGREVGGGILLIDGGDPGHGDSANATSSSATAVVAAVVPARRGSCHRPRG